MNKVFGYIFTGFGCLLVLILLILFFSEGSIIDSHSNFSDRRQIILSIMFTIFPIVGGLFLIFRKKEQITSDSHNITVEDNTSITNTQNNDDSIESKLEKLKSMLDKELITEEEFNAKKQKLIDEM